LVTVRSKEQRSDHHPVSLRDLIDVDQLPEPLRHRNLDFDNEHDTDLLSALHRLLHAAITRTTRIFRRRRPHQPRPVEVVNLEDEEAGRRQLTSVMTIVRGPAPAMYATPTYQGYYSPFQHAHFPSDNIEHSYRRPRVARSVEFGGVIDDDDDVHSAASMTASRTTSSSPPPPHNHHSYYPTPHRMSDTASPLSVEEFHELSNSGSTGFVAPALSGTASLPDTTNPSSLPTNLTPPMSSTSISNQTFNVVDADSESFVPRLDDVGANFAMNGTRSQLPLLRSHRAIRPRLPRPPTRVPIDLTADVVDIGSDSEQSEYTPSHLGFEDELSEDSNPRRRSKRVRSGRV
jgi:hypothetical protein